uniref:Membrane anchored junction protein n=1 Tax=Nannospalax galili TaxID=1026970 RepID=A0A8C6QMY8_NANGA
MSLKPFTYPFPETRFLHTGSIVYKFKIRYGDSIRGEEMENKETIIQELESQDGEPQQKHQDIAVSDATEAQEHGSKCRHGLPGPVVPPLQQGSSSPKELGTSGFFGFLSSLFPFRHFFRKSSQ